MSIFDDDQREEEYQRQRETSPADSVKNPVLKLRRATELQVPPPTQWLATGWLPRREITVLVGEEGIGKSLLWVLMAAHITTGTASAALNMPARKASDVVVIATEDSATEILARLNLAGADLKRVNLFCSEDDGTGSPIFGNSLTGDMLTLDALLSETADMDPALLVVDAWLDTVAGNLNIRDTQQARQALHPWKQLAQRHNVAVMLVTHTNRMDTASTRDLMGGTAALRQKARMVLFAARPQDDHDSSESHLWVGPDKSNVTGLVNAVKFHVAVEQVRDQTADDPGTTAHLTAPSDAAMTIRTLLADWKRQEQEADRKPTKAESAKESIRAYMRTHGTLVPSNDLKAHLRSEGFGKSVSEDAMRDMGSSTPSGAGGVWYYTLADQSSCQSPYSDPITEETSNTKNTRNTEDAITPLKHDVPSLPELTGLPGNRPQPGTPAGTPAPNKCTTCTQGRPTPRNIERGIFQCLECIRKGKAA